MTTGRADLRDAFCAECGARCIPKQTHLEHNGGWRKKILLWDWNDIMLDKYPGWDLVDAGTGNGQHPPFVRLAIRHRVDKSSDEIAREVDDVAKGKFYFREWSRDGSCSLSEGEIYDTGWWFEKREDAYDFIKRYGGQAG